MKKILLTSSFLLSFVFANAHSFSLRYQHASYGCPDVNCKEHPDCGWLPVCRTPESLEAISKEMYNAGNEKYLLVDMLRDGLLDENKIYSLDIYMEAPGEADIIPYVLQQRYNDKWTAFILTNGGRKKNIYHFFSVGIKPHELFDPNSAFQQIDKFSLWHHGFREKEQALVLREMIKDGLINPEDEFDIWIKDKAVKINNHPFPDTLKNKYHKLFNDLLGIDASVEGWSFSFRTSTKIKELIAE